MTATLNLLREAEVHTKLNSGVAYNVLQVKEGDEHVLAFLTRYYLFESMEIMFETTNAAAAIPQHTNNAIWKALDDFESAYLKYVLICSSSEKMYIEHDKWVTWCLLEAVLYLKLDKCEFHKEAVEYLELIRSTKDMSITPIWCIPNGIGAEKWKQCMGTWIVHLPWNCYRGFEIIIDSWFLSILTNQNDYNNSQTGIHYLDGNLIKNWLSRCR